MSGPVRKLLANPVLYRLFRASVVRRSYTARISEHVRAREGDRVLDIGCGTGSMLISLPPVDYVGVDGSPEYIEAARRIFGERGAFHCRRIGEEEVGELGRFDLVVANGLLHHLDDEGVVEAFRIARRALVPGGRVFTIDPCFAEGQSRLSRLLVSRDRGEHVRRPEGYLGLASRVFDRLRHRVYHDLLRIPYTHVVIEGG